MAKSVRKVKRGLKLASPSPEQPQTTTRGPQVSAKDLETQQAVTKAFSGLVVTMRSLNTQVNGLGLQGQTIPLLLATLDQIDAHLGEVTDRMWALRALVEAENAPTSA